MKIAVMTDSHRCVVQQYCYEYSANIFMSLSCISNVRPTIHCFTASGTMTIQIPQKYPWWPCVFTTFWSKSGGIIHHTCAWPHFLHCTGMCLPIPGWHVHTLWLVQFKLRMGPRVCANRFYLPTPFLNKGLRVCSLGQWDSSLWMACFEFAGIL
jgi:hypothetical protein